MTLPFLEGANWTYLVIGLLGFAALCVVWIAAHFIFKLTMRIFTLGCLGILVVGAACAAFAWFSR
jgi:hypothetical protein